MVSVRVVGACSVTMDTAIPRLTFKTSLVCMAPSSNKEPSFNIISTVVQKYVGKVTFALEVLSFGFAVHC